MSPGLRIDATVAWLGRGETPRRPVAIVIDGGAISYVGPPAGAPDAERNVAFGGFVMPAVADRHVHIRLSDPAAVLANGVAAVRDLAWPPDEIFPLADASELPTFNGPLVRAAGPMLTGRGGYPTTDRWAPPGTGLELEGPDHAARLRDEVVDLRKELKALRAAGVGA